jgi:hypothetical protein
LDNLHIEYHSENCFSVFNYNTKTDERSPILENAHIMINPENSDQVILRTNEKQIKLPFLIDENKNIQYFDLEG